MPQQFRIDWVDHRREPQCEPNPNYPEGINIDASGGGTTTCTVELPYPARRCGRYDIECLLCGYRALVTTAGRPDDPKSVKLPCHLRGDNRGN